MKFLIIDKRKRVGDLNTPHYAVTRLSDELRKRNIEFETGFFDELDFIVSKGKFHISFKNNLLDSYTHIIMRGHRTQYEYMMKRYVVEYCLQKSIKVQNADFINMVPFYDKLFQMKTMSENSVPYLPSAYTLDGRYFEKPELLATIGFPMIYKHTEGEYRTEIIDGEEKTKKNVFLAKNTEDLKRLYKERDNPEQTFLTQPSKYFIQKYVNIGEDYRALMIGGEYIGGWKRVATRNFLTVSKGEYSNYDNPTPKFMELAKSVNTLFQADYCAIDIIYSDEEPYVLEINMNPGFKAFETKIEGLNVDVAKAIIDQML
jgi:glutathione synthase/RimK-type ligase-like ATP-grasp enzyme